MDIADIKADIDLFEKTIDSELALAKSVLMTIYIPARMSNDIDSASAVAKIAKNSIPSFVTDITNACLEINLKPAEKGAAND